MLLWEDLVFIAVGTGFIVGESPPIVVTVVEGGMFMGGVPFEEG